MFIHIKKIIFIVIMSILFYAIASLVRAYSFALMSVVGFVGYFCLTLYFTARYSNQLKPVKVLIAIIIGILSLSLPFSIAYFTATANSLLSDIMLILGCFAGYGFYKSTKFFKYFFLLFSLFLCGFIYFIGYSLWSNKLNYGTYTGELSNGRSDFDLKMMNRSGDTITLQQLRGKVVVLDFWNSYCGICREKFPVFNNMSLKYETLSDQVVFYAVHCFDEEGNESYLTGSKILLNYDYSFSTLSISSKDSTLVNELGIEKFPRFLVFDKSGKLIFNGNIDFGEKLLKVHLQKNGLKTSKY